MQERFCKVHVHNTKLQGLYISRSTFEIFIPVKDHTSPTNGQNRLNNMLPFNPCISISDRRSLIRWLCLIFTAESWKALGLRFQVFPPHATLMVKLTAVDSKIFRLKLNFKNKKLLRARKHESKLLQRGFIQLLATIKSRLEERIRQRPLTGRSRRGRNRNNERYSLELKKTWVHKKTCLL